MKIIIPIRTYPGSSNYYSLWLSFFIALSFSVEAQTQPTDWELKVDKNGIQIFTRWIESNGQKAREIKATFKVSAPAEKLTTVLKDQEHATDWMAGAKTFNILTENGPKSWYSYTEFDLPWPLQNQDLVTLYKIEQADTKTTKVKVEAFPNYRPAVSNVERIQHFEACWTFVDLGNGTTEVTYCAFTFRKPSTPRWILDPVVQNTLWKTMSGFREQAE
ncbi:MAG: START domain-containing protein [Saprospiraceae bacterium]|nr:hypothetical protein [Lewinella sp.]